MSNISGEIVEFASPELQSQMFFVYLKGPGFNPEIALNKTVE